MGRLILFLLLGSIGVFGLISINLNTSTTDAASNSTDYYKNIHSRNIANSMVQMIVSQLSDSTSWRVNSQTSKSLFNGTAYYTIKDTSFAGESLIKINVQGVFQGAKKTITTYVKFSVGFVPPSVRGAWTANSNLNNTISDMYIDGRDHDLKNNVIPNSGVYGVSTSTAFVNTQKGYIGGTKNGVDYSPQYPENPNSIEQNYNWGGTFPNSPDEILGYPKGTLRSIALSGSNGSQYVTNPKNLSLPLSGVTYIEPPYGDDGKDDDESPEYKLDLKDSPNNKGILVVHNSIGNSRIKQLKSKFAFQGLIIGDYMFHFHLDVLGAVLLLSPDLEKSKNCGGNRDHWVNYSSASIKAATSIVAKSGKGSGGYASGYGFAKKRVDILYWFE